jgi:hypothetical protein
VDILSVANVATLFNKLPSATTDVILLLKAHGFFEDGKEFETAALTMPITICAGCIGVPVCVDNTTTPPTVKGASVVCPPNLQTRTVVCQ